MRIAFPLSIVFLLALVPACYSPPPENQVNIDSIRAVKEGDSIRLVLEVLQIEKRQHTLDSLQIRVDTLAVKNFMMTQLVFGFPTYSHNAWWNEYLLRGDLLTCAVDASGNLYLISCLSGQDATARHNEIVVEIGVNKDQYISDVAASFPTDSIPCACNKEFAMFDGDPAWKIAEAIALHKSEKIVVRPRNSNDFVSHYVLSTRDKEAIADCVELAKTIQLLNAE